MEQELIELLLAAKKALLTGQGVCAQANTLSQESGQHVQVIEQTWPKILFLHQHSGGQIGTLRRIQEFLSFKTQDTRRQVQAREATLTTLSMELTSVFHTLKHYTVDSAILQESGLRSMEKSQATKDSQMYSSALQHTTLFHYIDDQAVLELQRQADDEIGEVENHCTSLATMTHALSTSIAELESLQDTAISISLDEDASHFASEKAQLQEDEISKMADILTSLTNHYDQLGEATRLCQSDPQAFQHIDISVLQDDHAHVPEILQDLRESLEMVDSISEETRVRMQVYLSVQEELVQVLDKLETFGAAKGLVDTICDRMVGMEAEMKESEFNLDTLFKQLEELAEWYQRYLESYNYLVIEVERRKRVLEEQERLQKELMVAAEEKYNDELEERRAWFKQHGEYLPDALCPFIFDMPSKLTIALQNSAHLPEISRASIEKVHRMICYANVTYFILQAVSSIQPPTKPS
ncbi:autophagy-related protein 17 [Spinellus fusiger]|nr:autophagy-related protein 17 [Spinellus fusiger]